MKVVKRKGELQDVKFDKAEIIKAIQNYDQNNFNIENYYKVFFNIIDSLGSGKTQNIIVKDKTYLHKKHSSHQLGRFHLELIIKSEELSKYNKIQATKKIYKILDEEIKKHIHSLQILIN